MAFTSFDTLVHGFQHKELTLHDVLQVTNPLKVYVKELGIEKSTISLLLDSIRKGRKCLKAKYV